MTVLCCGDIEQTQLFLLLKKFDLCVKLIPTGKSIPGSWFGEPEAGLVGNTLYIRSDTPVHSALHESCHYICMDKTRRKNLNANAGGDYDEENAVCYLSILLSDHIDGFGHQRMFCDMDEWGYTFRLGSSQAWFEQDADDALNWLIINQIIGTDKELTWRYRNTE